MYIFVNLGFATAKAVNLIIMEIISAILQNYLENSCETESDWLKHIDRETHLKTTLPRMLSGHFQGRVLSLLSKLVAPTRILEIGTFTGYATLCLAEGLTKDGLIHTIDVNKELEDLIKDNFYQSPYYEKIRFHLGEAHSIIPNLDDIFDLVFIDADKKNNAVYYDLIFDKIRNGGLILVDNVLWNGKVHEGKTDSDTLSISEFNQKIITDTRVEKLILPIRDGIFVIRKK